MDAESFASIEFASRRLKDSVSDLEDVSITRGIAQFDTMHFDFQSLTATHGLFQPTRKCAVQIRVIVADEVDLTERHTVNKGLDRTRP